MRRGPHGSRLRFTLVAAQPLGALTIRYGSSKGPTWPEPATTTTRQSPPRFGLTMISTEACPIGAIGDGPVHQLPGSAADQLSPAGHPILDFARFADVDARPLAAHRKRVGVGCDEARHVEAALRTHGGRGHIEQNLAIAWHRHLTRGEGGGRLPLGIAEKVRPHHASGATHDDQPAYQQGDRAARAGDQAAADPECRQSDSGKR